MAASTRSTAEPRRAAQQLDRQQQRGRDGDEHGRQRERAGEVGREALVDRQRHGLRDAAERAREHQRRAELAERAAPRQREAGEQARAGGRDRDAQERARLAGAERARGVEPGPVDRLEGGLRLAQVERRGDERQRDDDARRRQHELDARVLDERRRGCRSARARRAARCRRPPAAAPAAARSA